MRGTEGRLVALRTAERRSSLENYMWWLGLISHLSPGWEVNDAQLGKLVQKELGGEVTSLPLE